MYARVGFLLTSASILLLALLLHAGPAEGKDPPRRVKRDPLAPRLNWEHKNDSGMRYQTTSHASDLDLEVRRGARILKYANGEYVRTIHRQYKKVCGAASLAMVLKQLGIATGPSRKRAPRPGMRPVPTGFRLPQDVDRQGPATVDLGYRGSMEHIMWLGYHRRRLNIDGNSWNAGKPLFMNRDGVLNTVASTVSKHDLDGVRLDYYAGQFVPNWMWEGPAIGLGKGRDFYMVMTGIMNYHFSGRSNGPWRDAMPLYFAGGSDATIVAYRRIVKGFIDHGISVVCGLEGGGHFNALIGYRGDVSPASSRFFVYTADPLDGYGRTNRPQPLTWRRMELSGETTTAGSGVLMAIVAWNHHADGGANVRFRRGSWAGVVDRENGNDWLTGSGRQPTAHDPLNSPLALPAERMP